MHPGVHLSHGSVKAPTDTSGEPFKGRASRSEFGKFAVFVTIVLSVPLVATGGSTGEVGSGLSTLVTVSLLAAGIFT